MPAGIRSIQSDDTKKILVYGLWPFGPECGPNNLASGLGTPRREASGIPTPMTREMDMQVAA